MANFDFAIDVPGRSEWSNVDLLRTSVQNCFMVMFADVDGCDAIAMVVGELLENAVKYGAWEEGRSEFRLRVRGEGDRVLVSIDNPIRPGDPGVNELIETVEWIARAPSPADAYRERVLRIVADRESGGSGSKLGLVRIAYEASCKLRAAVDGDQVRVTAEMQFA